MGTINLRGPWWLALIIGVIILGVGIVAGRLAPIAAGALLIVISFGRLVLIGR